MDPVAEALPRGVQVVQATSRHGAIWIDHRRSLADHAITFLPGGDITTNLSDDPAKLVPEHHGVVDWPGVVGGPLMQVAPTHANIGDFQENVAWSDLRGGEFADLDRTFLGREVDDGSVHVEGVSCVVRGGEPLKGGLFVDRLTDHAK